MTEASFSWNFDVGTLNAVVNAFRETIQDRPGYGLPLAACLPGSDEPVEDARRPNERASTKLTTVSGKLLRDFSDKETVSINVAFRKINDINTIQDRFSADVFVQASWREPRLDGQSQQKANDDVQLENYWNPKLYVENAIGELKSSISRCVRYDTAGLATVCETRLISGTFFEFMELNKFPFDSQDLTVTLVSEREVAQLELVEDASMMRTIFSKTNSCEQEWRLHKFVNVWNKIVSKISNAETLQYPGFCCAAKVSRRPQYFVWNIIVFMSTICSLACLTFTVEQSAPQYRLQSTFFLLLSTVTFKFVVNKSLPRINYLTYMDKYILGLMVILCGVCVWHAAVGGAAEHYRVTNHNVTSPEVTSWPDTTSHELPNASAESTSCPLAAGDTATPEIAKIILADNIALAMFGSLYLLFHAVFVTFIYTSTNSRRTKPNIFIPPVENERTARPSLKQSAQPSHDV